MHPNLTSEISLSKAITGGLRIMNSDVGNSYGTLGAIFSIEEKLYGISAGHVLMGRAHTIHTGKVMAVHSEGMSEVSLLQSLTSDLLLDYLLFDISVELSIATIQTIASFPGMITRYQHLVPGMKVKKYGSTTGVTHGIVDECYEGIDGHSLILSLNNDLLTEPGDSGAIWVLDDDASDMTAVGLSIATSGNSAVATDFVLIYNDLFRKGKKLNLDMHEYIA